MDIIKTDFKKGVVKLKVNDLDDLWYLSHLIDPGDFVKGKTTRKIRIGEGDNAKVAKKTLTLKIEAENITLTKDGLSLRINGLVKEGPEEVPKDSYHTISLEELSQFTLEKPQWLSYQKDKLKEASEKKYSYLICILDREEAIFALTKKSGYEVLVKIKGEVPKKRKTMEIKKDFYQELIKVLATYNARYSPEKIILASPAFYKEDLLKQIKEDDLKSKIVIATCSDVSENSLDETIKQPELAQTLKNSRVREEQLLVEELLSEINKDNLAVYGEKEVYQAIDTGAVRELLITLNFLKKKKESEEFKQLDEKMKQVDHLKGKINIISSEQESGKKLDGLGGMAAILRYKI